MPHPSTGSPGEGESSTVNPVLPSRSAMDRSSARFDGQKVLEWQRRAGEGSDAGAQVDLQVAEMEAKQGVKGRPGLVPPKGWLHFVAGGVGGMCGAIVTSPLDVVKTRLQSDLFQNKAAAATVSINSGVLASTRRLAYHFVETGHILRNIAIKESPRALFKGLGPTLVGVIPARSINFFTYGNGKLILADQINGGKESPAVHLLAAASAGIVTATATNPIWVVKTRLQLESHAHDKAVEVSRQAAIRKSVGGRPNVHPSSSASKPAFSTWSKQLMASQATTQNLTPKGTFSSRFFKPSPNPARPSTNSVQMALRIVRSEGIAGLYKGMSASYLGVAEGTIQWTLYEQLKQLSRGPVDSIGSPRESQSKARQWMGTVGSAGTAKLIASLITYPHEVVRTRLRQEPGHGEQRRYTGLVQTIRVVMREEGAAALYGGLSAHLLRVVPNAAIMFIVYETMLANMNTAKTSS